MSLLKAMATVGGFTFASRITGFLRDMLTANILGAGAAADAFIVALKLPNFFRRITGEGAFSVSFLPLFAQKREAEGDEKALVFASDAAALMITILVPFTMLAILAMPWAIYALAPGFQDDPVRYGMAVTMTQMTFPYLLLVSLVALMGGILNSFGQFAPFAAAPILFNCALIAGLYFGDRLFGFPAQGMALGVTISGFLQCALLWWCLKKSGICLHFFKKPIITDDIKKLFTLMGPGLIGAGVYQINLFADMMIASLLPSGAISHLYYADRLNQLPLSVIGVAIGTALLPMFSKALIAKNHDEVRDLYNRSIEYGIILCFPAAAALMVSAPAIVSTLFEHGKFTMQDTASVALVLSFYALGLPAYVISKVFATTYWADQDTKTPVKIAIIAALSNIIFSLALSQFMGVAGIALSTGLAGWLQIYLLWQGVKKHPEIRFDERLKTILPKVAVCTAIMAVFVLFCVVGLQGWFDASVMDRIFALIAMVGGSMLVYGACIFASGVLRVADMRRYFTRKKSNS